LIESSFIMSLLPWLDKTSYRTTSGIPARPVTSLHESLDLVAQYGSIEPPLYKQGSCRASYDEQRLYYELVPATRLDCVGKSRDRPLLNHSYRPSKCPPSCLLKCRPSTFCTSG
jgi:hypothetical protein